MLAGFLLGLVHDRRLMREAQVNLAIRWFVGYGLHETLPDHSRLTRIRQRWGPERFRRVFTRTVQACVAAGIAKGEVVHIDSSLIRADVSWDAIARRHADAVEAAEAIRRPSAAHRAEAGQDLGVHDRPGRLAGHNNKPGAASRPTSSTPLSSQAWRRARCGGHNGRDPRHQPLRARSTPSRPPPAQGPDRHAGRQLRHDAPVRRARGARHRGGGPAKAERPPRPGVIPVRRFKLDASTTCPRCPAAALCGPMANRTRMASRLTVPAQGLRPAGCGPLLQPVDEATSHPAAQGSSRPDPGPA